MKVTDHTVSGFTSSVHSCSNLSLFCMHCIALGSMSSTFCRCVCMRRLVKEGPYAFRFHVVGSCVLSSGGVRSGIWNLDTVISPIFAMYVSGSSHLTCSVVLKVSVHICVVSRSAFSIVRRCLSSLPFFVSLQKDGLINGNACSRCFWSVRFSRYPCVVCRCHSNAVSYTHLTLPTN